MQKIQKNEHKIHYTRIAGLIFALLFLYVVLPQLSVFKSSIGLLKNTKLEWLALAWGSAIVTYAFAALVYITLVGKNLKLGTTVAVQLAASFANRLLPIGAGAVGVNYLFLRKQHLSQSNATAVVAINNLIGFVGHILVFVTVIVMAHVAFTYEAHIAPKIWIISATILVAIIGIVAAVPRVRQRLNTLMRSTLHDMAAYSKSPSRLALALPASISTTLTYALTLYAAAHALTMPLTFAQSFVVLTLGVIGATVAPTPGGLLGAEAGIATGLLAYGANSGEAVAIALLYRLLTYWFTLLVGGIAFVFVQRKKLL